MSSVYKKIHLVVFSKGKVKPKSIKVSGRVTRETFKTTDKVSTTIYEQNFPCPQNSDRRPRQSRVISKSLLNF